MQKKTRTVLLALAALALPAAAAAQTPAAPAPAPAQPAAPAQDEITQIQQRLGQLQQRAMQDPAVQAAQATFTAEVMAAMEKLDPAAKEKAARAEAIKAEVDAARQANDNAKLNELAAEAQALQAYFQQLRPRAIALPEIQEKRKVFTEALFAKMTELDAEAPRLVARLEELRSGNAQSTPSQR